MMCISLWQPWSSLLFLEETPDRMVKTYETRSWPAHRYLLGQRIAIHAAKKAAKPEDLNREVRLLLLQNFGTDDMKSLPRGAIIGTAKLTEIKRVNMPPALMGATPSDIACGDWTPGRWVWRLDEARALPVPVPYTGRQGFFNATFEEPAHA